MAIIYTIYTLYIHKKNEENFMTANIALNDYVYTENDSTNSTKSEFLNYISKQISEENLKKDYQKIIKHTTITMKTLANAYYKDCAFLESSDIEHIKTSLHNYVNNDKRVEKFKNAIIEDLTQIQNQIETNHVKKLKNLEKEKELCEKQVKVLDFAKNKLIMDRLSKVQWPYDSKTKEYESKIAGLKIKIEKDQQKIEELQKNRPSADEKDILIYQLRLKEKYSF